MHLHTTLHAVEAALAASALAAGGGDGMVDLSENIAATTGGFVVAAARVLAAVFILIGATFCTLASIGMVRMPDVFCRMQAAAKAGTLGVGCIMFGAMLHFVVLPGGVTVAVESILIILFIFLTTPAAAHLIGRAAYISGVKLWKNTTIDELQGCYADADRDAPSSPQQPANPANPATPDAPPKLFSTPPANVSTPWTSHASDTNTRATG